MASDATPFTRSATGRIHSIGCLVARDVQPVLLSELVEEFGDAAGALHTVTASCCGASPATWLHRWGGVS